ncbi:tail terminator [Gordonia phage Cleo]|uniref:Tail terminator n=1 Tax=Gordonia phage Gibbous TaxID=2652405 RepID=A0A5J6T3U2_9CAUD|nr:tail terminator [Gordonia phage Gibbous]QFG05089.1 tail terminator [Gordonia phage Gibbous]QGJ96799.1 tail terminator [Gordonia phage Cleo]QRI45941.1 tail terminator [Gordonia phage Dre3]
MFGVAEYPSHPPALKSMIRLLESGGFTPVGEDVPKVRPNLFYRVELVGGTEHRTGAMSFPVFAFQVYAMDTGMAETQSGYLLAFLKSKQFTALEHVQYRGWSTVALPAPFPDPRVADRRRWQLSGEFGLSKR